MQDTPTTVMQGPPAAAPAPESACLQAAAQPCGQDVAQEQQSGTQPHRQGTACGSSASEATLADAVVDTTSADAASLAACEAAGACECGPAIAPIAEPATAAERSLLAAAQAVPALVATDVPVAASAEDEPLGTPAASGDAYGCMPLPALTDGLFSSPGVCSTSDGAAARASDLGRVGTADMLDETAGVLRKPGVAAFVSSSLPSVVAAHAAAAASTPPGTGMAADRAAGADTAMTVRRSQVAAGEPWMHRNRMHRNLT